MKASPEKQSTPKNNHLQQDFFKQSSADAFFGPTSIQPKLTIGQPNDKYEQEADAMAAQVVSGNANASSPNLGSPQVQTMCAECAEEQGVQKKAAEEKPKEEAPAISKKEEEEKPEISKMAAEEEPKEEAPAISKKEEKEEEPALQTKPLLMRKTQNGASVGTSTLATQLNNSRGSGQTLPRQTNQEMSQSFGTDFSQVRIHTDRRSEEMNQGLSARAFTHGSDIYFNRGEYNPGSTEGKTLLAHELTHVVQQGRGGNFVQKNGADTDPNLYIPGDNRWYDSQGEAFSAANEKLQELTLLHGSVYQIEHHPLPARGLPHYHVHHIAQTRGNYQGHFFYRTRNRRRQYKVDWHSVYNVVVALGLSLAMIAVIIAALLDPEPATKLGLAGLSVVMITTVMSMLRSDSETEA